MKDKNRQERRTIMSTGMIYIPHLTSVSRVLRPLSATSTSTTPPPRNDHKLHERSTYSRTSTSPTTCTHQRMRMRIEENEGFTLIQWRRPPLPLAVQLLNRSLKLSILFTLFFRGIVPRAGIGLFISLYGSVYWPSQASSRREGKYIPACI
jgi:hypothetical protein